MRGGLSKCPALTLASVLIVCLQPYANASSGTRSEPPVLSADLQADYAPLVPGGCIGDSLGTIAEVAALDECRMVCDAVGRCRAFTFDSASNECMLFKNCDGNAPNPFRYSGLKMPTLEEDASSSSGGDDDQPSQDADGSEAGRSTPTPEMTPIQDAASSEGGEPSASDADQAERMDLAPGAQTFTRLRATACEGHTLVRLIGVSDPAACEEACSNEPGCGAYTHDPNRQRCYLKWDCSDRNLEAGRVSGVRYGYGWFVSPQEANATEYSYMPGYGCTERTMRREEGVMGYFECQELCDAEAGCGAFTYGADRRRCYLKSSCRETKRKSSNFSGVVSKDGSSSEGTAAGNGKREFDTSSPSLRQQHGSESLELDVPKYTFLAGIQCTAPLMARVDGIASTETCKAICSSRMACGAFTFQAAQGNCFLKDRCGGHKYSRESMSGVKASEAKSKEAKFDIMADTACNGNTYETVLLGDGDGSSENQCARICAAVDWCRAFNHDKRRKSCQLKRWGGDMEPNDGFDCGVLVGKGGDVPPVQSQADLAFWDRTMKGCGAAASIEGVESTEATPYDGKLYRLPEDRGIHSLLRPASYTGRWHNHASHMLIAPSGTIIMAWFWGEEGKDGVAIVTARLELNATCWTDLQMVSVQPGRSAQNPVLMYDDKKNITVLLHTSQAADMGQGTSEVLMLTSKSEGRSWAKKPVVIMREKGVFVRNTPIRSRKNPEEWILPMYYTPDGLRAQLSQYAAVKFSTDPSQVWSEPSAISKPGMRLAQPSITRLKNGNLLAILRDRAAFKAHRSVSMDEGETWSEPQAINVPNNNKAVTVLTLGSGAVLLMFTNSDDKNDKYPMSVGMSLDDGMTFPFIRDLQDTIDIFRNSEFSYGAMVWSPAPCSQRHIATTAEGAHNQTSLLAQNGTGSIHMSYTYSFVTKRSAIRYLCINNMEAWVKTGPPSLGAFRGDQKDSGSAD